MASRLQLLLLHCACAVMPVMPAGTVVVKAPCSQDVELPCTAVPCDPQLLCQVFWTKLPEAGEKPVELSREALQLLGQEQSSVATPSENPTSLRLRNATNLDSGTYRCTLVGLDGQRNHSGRVTLEVTGCHKKGREENLKNYRAEIVLLVVLVVFYLTLIIFTCKFAKHQSIFPDFSKPAIEPAFLLVTSPNKHLEPVSLHKTEPV